MKKIVALIFGIISFVQFSNGQTFTYSGSTATPDGSTTCVNIPVTGVAGALNYDYGLISMTLSLTNPDLSDVEVTLIDPAGNSHTVIGSYDLSGTTLSNVTISSTGTPIDDETGTYSGTYRPDTYGLNWCEINNNTSVGDGTWQVCVNVPSWGSAGAITLAELNFGVEAESIYGTNVATNSITDPSIPVICDANGYIGFTNGCYNVQNTSGNLASEFCGALDNNSWISFQADSTDIDISVEVSDCSDGTGVQFSIMTTANFTAFTEVDCENPLSPGTNTVNFNGFVPGQMYFLMVDGWAGDQCKYEITASSLSGIAIIEATVDNAAICEGESVNLTGSGADFYFWSANPTVTFASPTSSAQTDTPTADTWYIMSGTNSVGCNTIDSVQVTVTPSPTAEAGAPAAIDCANPTTVLDGSGSDAGANISYSWSPSVISGGNVVSGGTTTAPTVDAAGTYVITVTDNTLGCASTDSVVVTEDVVPPVASAGADDVIDCSNPSVVLDGTGSASGSGETYNWTTVGGNIVSDGTTTGPTVDAAGTYTIEVTDPSNGCSDTDDVIVTIDIAAPTADAGTDQIIDCANPTATLDGSGSTSGAGITYLWTSGLGNITAGVSTNTATVDAVATYTLTVTDGNNGCTATDDVDVTAGAAAVIASAGLDMVIDCNNSSVTLDGTGSDSGAGVTYVWTTVGGNIVSGGTSDSPVVDAAGTYTITVTSIGCTTTDDVVVTEDLVNPTASAGADMQLDCNNATLTLDGSGSDTGVNITYSWTTVGGNITSGNTTMTPDIDAAGAYTITVTNTTNGCTSTDATTIILDNTVPAVNAGIDLSIDCVTPTAALDGSTSTAGAGITYTWTTVGGNITSGAATNTAVVDAAGTYTLTVDNTNNGCSASDDAIVTLNATLPVADAGLDALIDCANPSISLDGSGSESGVGITYAWTTIGGNIVSGSTGSTPVIDAAGTYTITVTNTVNGCANTDDVVITDDFTAPTAEAGPGQTITCAVTSVVLDGTGSSTGVNYTYAWSGGNVVSDGTTLAPTVDQVTTYTITVTDSNNGCTATDNVIVSGSAGMPVADAGADMDLTCSVLSLNLDGSASEAAAANITHVWSTTGGNITAGGSTTTPTIDADGTYTITVTNTTSGCVASDDVIVSINNGTPSSSAGADMIIDCDNPAVALDGSLSLTGAGVTYNWTTGGGTIVSGGTTLTPAVSAAGTYTITVTDANTGCVGTDDVVVTENLAAPLAVASYPGDLTCTTTSIILGGTGSASGVGISYNWTTGAGNIVSNGTTLTPTIDAAGTYTITVTDASNGCSSTDNVIVGLDDTAPIADAGLDMQKDCANPTVTLDGSASTVASGVTYNWTTVDGSIVSNGTTLSPTADAAGTYTITVTDGNNGCTASDDMVVTESVALPIASAMGTGQIDCLNSNLVLDGSGSDAGLDYSWSTLDGNIVSGGTTTTPTVDQGGTYVITVTNLANSCQATASIVVGEDSSAPTVVAGLTQTVDCYNPTITLNANGTSTGANYTYNWTTIGGNIVADGTTLNPIVNQGGTYTLEVMNTLNGCTQTDNVLINQNSTLPIAEAGSAAEVSCLVPTLTLNGGGSSTGTVGYQWTSIDGNITLNDNTLTPSVDAGGTYTITVTDIANGCTATDDVVITENLTAPTADAGLDQVLSCLNPIATMDGAASAVGGTITYAWSTLDGLILGAGNTNSDFAILAGTYTITVFDASNGCSSTDDVVVTGDLTAPNLITLPVDPVCESAAIIDVGNYVNISGGTWSGTGMSNPSSVFDVSVGPGSYAISYEVTDPVNFCTSTETIDIVVNPNPTVTINSQNLACVGDSIRITVDGADTYIWSNGANVDEFYHQVLPGTAFYSVVGTDTITGCIASTNVSVEGVNPSVSVIGLSPQNSYPYYAELGAIGIDVDSYEWIADGNVIGIGDEINYLFGQGQHTVTLVGVDNTSACADTMHLVFELLDPANIFVPTGFSPNGDGHNDVFTVGANFVECQFLIFNRWGELVYSDKATTPSWDGKDLSGNVCQEDVYIYKIMATYSTGEEYERVGHVTLIR